MVILQFNKLIRNKLIWGVFAIAISAFFAFDFLLDDIRGADEGRSSGGAGLLAGKEVDAKLYSAIAEDVRGIGRQRDWKTDQSEVNRRAWENYAALVVADKAGIKATAAEVRDMIRRDPSFQANGAFSFALYERLLRENSITPERFEESLIRRTTLMRIGQAVLGSATWASPMELDQAIADMTDTFTVKIATFTQDKKSADAVKIDDAGVKKWYDENSKSLELPDRVKIRYVKFDATDKAKLAAMTVTEDELRDRYDVTIDKYTSTDTNGVETVKKFEEVKDAIEGEVRQIALVNCFETNLSFKVYAVKAADGKSRLDEIAAAEGLKVETSDWIAPGGEYRPGFAKMPSQVFPGAQGFSEAVAELDSSSEDLRYAVISSEKAVWLMEKADFSASHIPTFEEAKEVIRPRALSAAKADAFKAEVEAIAKKGAAAVAATKNVSTNIVFSVSDLKPGAFENQNSVARAVMRLKKGEVSSFTETAPGRGLLVICEDRQEGDAAKAMILRSQIQNDLSVLAARQIPESWMKWNLARLGFEPGEISSVEKVETEE